MAVGEKNTSAGTRWTWLSQYHIGTSKEVEAETSKEQSSDSEFSKKEQAPFYSKEVVVNVTVRHSKTYQ